MRVKKLFLPLLFLAAVVLCAGCGASREQAAPYDSPAPVPEAAAPVVEAGSGQTEGSATDKYVHFYINDTCQRICLFQILFISKNSLRRKVGRFSTPLSSIPRCVLRF